MLDAMPRGLFKFWKRVYQVEPWGEKEDWQRSATIAAAANNAGIIAAGRMPDDLCEIYTPAHYLPTREPERKTPEKTPDQSQAFLAGLFGPKV